MKYDSIAVDRMRPDASLYEKGVRLIKNLVPWDSDWRALEAPLVESTTTPPADSVTAGSWSDPNGLLWVATRREGGPSSRLYEYDPAAPGFTNRTPAGDYAGAPLRWRFAKFGASVIAAPENNNTGAAIPLQVRSGAGNFANLVPGVDRPAPKYVGVCKSYLVCAHNLAWGGAGVYAAADPYLVSWSSRNNATVHVPGTDRAGFVSLRSDKGEITGLWCFEEFFLVFQQFAITRFTWVGGDNVWDQQGIAGPTLGLSNPLWADGIVGSDRSAYYRSNTGFAVIQNGEAAALLDEDGSNQFFSTGTEFPVSPLFNLAGVLHHTSRNIVWTANRGGAYFQVVYGIPSGRLTILTGQDAPEIAMGRLQVETTAPFSSLVFFGIDGSGDLEARRLLRADPRVTQVATVETLRYRGTTGGRISLHSLRPLLLCDLLGGTYPTISVAVNLIQDPIIGTAETKTVTSASRDPNGWWTDQQFPMSANELTLVVTMPSLGESTELREFPAVELALDNASVF